MTRRILKRVFDCLSHWKSRAYRTTQRVVIPMLEKGRASTIRWGLYRFRRARTGIRRACWFVVPWSRYLIGILLLFGVAYYFFWALPTQQIAAVEIAADKNELSSKELYE